VANGPQTWQLATPALTRIRKRKEFKRTSYLQELPIKMDRDGTRSMPHCSKCGKMPPLGLKRLLTSLWKLIQITFEKATNAMKLNASKFQKKAKRIRPHH